MRLTYCFLAAIIALATAGLSKLGAQTLGEPIAIPVHFAETATFDISGDTLWHSVTVYGEASHPGASDGELDIGGNDASWGVARLQPNQVYGIVVDDESTTSSNFSLSPPPGFTAIINGVVERTIDTTGGGVFDVEIIPESQIPAAHAGVATSLAKDRVFWQVSTGFLQDGTSAGWVSINDLGYGTNLSDMFTPAALSYSAGSASEVTVYNDPDTLDLSQVKTAEAGMKVVVDSSTSYELDFYASENVSGSTAPFTFSGYPYVKYIISEGTSASQVTITSETLNSGGSIVRTATTSVTRAQTSYPYTWNTQDWYTSSGNCLVAGQVSDALSTSSGTPEVATVENPTNSQLALTTTSLYTLEDWGLELSQKTLGSNSSSQVTSTYQYYTDSSGTNDYGFVQSMSTNGHWTGYEYQANGSDDGNDGIVSVVHTQYLNSSTSIPTNLIYDSSGSMRTAYTYTADIFGIDSLPHTITTTLGSSSTAISTTTINYDGITDSVYLNEMPTVTTSRQDAITGPQGSTTLYSGTRYYREDTYDEFFRSKPCSVTHADNTKDDYVYQRGGPPTGGGSPVFSGLTGNGGLYSQVAVIHGTASGSTAYTSFSGCDIDPIYLVANESTMDVTIRDSNSHVVKTLTDVWDGSNWDTIHSTSYTYDAFSNQMLSESTSNNQSLTNTYSGQQLSTQTDAAGVVTTYTYDAAGRVATAVKSASSSSLANKTQTTGFSYDAANHVTTKAISDSFDHFIETTAAYDDAGRPTSSSDTTGATTSYSYSPSSLTTTVTLPNGATKVDVTLPDGHLSSETGTGVVASYYAYSTDGNGNLTTTINYGSSESSREEQIVTDMLGRTASTSHPTFNGASTDTVTYTYNSLGQLVQISESGGGVSIGNTLYQYDAMGERTCQSLSSGTSVNLSTDRVVQTSHAISSDTSGNYWDVTTTSTYPMASSSTPFVTGIEKHLLAGFSTGEIGDTQITDSYGNVTDTSVWANSSNNTVTSKTIGPGIASGSAATTVTVAGLPISQCGYDGLTTTFSYDTLWRPSSQTDSRGNTTTTNYLGYTTRPSSVVDQSGAALATYTYDGACRVSSLANAGGKFTYFNYDNLNHVTQEWGDVPQPVEYTYDSYGARTGMKTFQSADTYVPGSGWSGGGTTSNTTWNFDSSTGLLSSKTDNSEHGPTYTYDGLGRVSTRAWVGNGTATYSYDPTTGQLTGVSYSGGAVTTPNLSYSYNRSGQLTGVTDATGSRTFAYDESIDENPLELEGEQLDSSYYGGKWLSRLYDPSTGVGGSDYGPTLPGFVLGQPIGFQLGNSENSKTDLSQNYAYSEYGVFLGVNSQTQGDTARNFIYSRASSSELVAGYSDWGNSFSQTRSYDPSRDLLTKIQGKYGSTVCTEYDLQYNSLRQVTSTTQTGTAFTDYDGSTGSTYRLFGYDGHGQLTTDVGYLGTLTGSSTFLPDRDYTYSYDAQGNRTASNYSAVSAYAESYTVNALNQITGKTNLSVPMSGTVLNTSGVGVVLSTSTSSGGSAVSAVAAGVVGGFWSGEVTPPTNSSGTPSNSETPSSFYVTATAGLAGTHFSPSESNPINAQQHEITMAAASQTIAYDSDGNLYTDGLWTYTYDAENRLVQMVASSGTELSGLQLNFVYDYMGRRVEKKVTTSGTVTYDHRFVYDGWNLIADYQVSGGSLTLYRTFTWGLDVSGSLTATGGVGALLEVTNCASGTPADYFPTYDGNGNVASLVRASDGTVAAAYEYSAFGQPLRAQVIDSNVGDNPFRFSTKFADTETGLVYYGNRFYSSNLGRFINRDPVEESGGINLYAFCGNNGISSIDILGFLQPGDPDNPLSEAAALNRAAEEQGIFESANAVVSAIASGGVMGDAGGAFSNIPQSGVMQIEATASPGDDPSDNESGTSVSAVDQGANAESYTMANGSTFITDSGGTVEGNSVVWYSTQDTSGVSPSEMNYGLATNATRASSHNAPNSYPVSEPNGNSPKYTETANGDVLVNSNGKWALDAIYQPANHVESDGKGHLVVVVTDDTTNPVIIQSIQIHENVHISDALASNPTIALNAPANMVLVGESPLISAQSEVSASTAQLGYLNSVLSNPGNSGLNPAQLQQVATYRMFVQGYLNSNQAIVNRYSNTGN